MRRVDNPDTFRENVRKHLQTIIKSDKITTNLEKGIFNYTIKTAGERNIVKKWYRVWVCVCFKLLTIFRVIVTSRERIQPLIPLGSRRKYSIIFI